MRKSGFKRMLPVDLTEDERLAKGDELSKTVAEYDKVEKEKKEAAATATAKLKRLRHDISDFAITLERGTEEREVDCIERLSPMFDAVEVVRTDTHNVVETRPLDARDRQDELPFDAAGAPVSIPVTPPKAPKANGKGLEEGPFAGAVPQDFDPAPVGHKFVPGEIVRHATRGQGKVADVAATLVGSVSVRFDSRPEKIEIVRASKLALGRAPAPVLPLPPPPPVPAPTDGATP